VVEQVVKVIKNIWFIGATITSSTVAVIVFIEENSTAISNHDVEIGVALFSVLFLTGFALHHLTHKKVVRVKEDVKSIKDDIKDLAIANLISDIERFYDNHIKYESLRIHQVQRLHELEARRVRLNVNSFNERKLKELNDKPLDKVRD